MMRGGVTATSGDYMKYKEYNCSKCSKSNTCNLIIADGKFDSNKGKLYCEDCYYTKERMKELKDAPSIDLMELLEDRK